MPKPKPRESESDFVERCVPIVIDEGTAKDGKQAAAICHSLWRDSKKEMSMNLLDEIRNRSEKSTEHNFGIVPADRYVRTIQECVGSDACYKFASKGTTSFSDVIEKAAKTLTYNNPDTVVKNAYLASIEDARGEGIEIPKNSLMVFKHILTSSRKDRDGDILHPEGAVLDDNMLLLWQHVHTLPIGKCLGVASQDKKRLTVYSSIVDMNDLSHDAAVMVDNKMGRFSHGFRALDFNKMKEESGKTTSGPGFEVLHYEVMEESLVSVPSNVDSVTEEIIVDLVEGKKLTSGIMKRLGANYREKMPTSTPVLVNFSVSVDGKEVDSGRIETKGQSSGCGCGAGKGEQCTCSSSAKEDDKSSGTSEGTEKTDDQKMTCPKCGSKMVDGTCEKCGYSMGEKEEDKGIGNIEEKVGRVLSSKNIKMLREIRTYVKELDDREFALSHRGRGYCRKCMKMLDELIGDDSGSERSVGDELTTKEHLARFLRGAGEQDINLASSILDELREQNRKTKQVEEAKRFFRKETIAGG